MHLLPGSPLPAWVEPLELEAFGTAWGPLTDREHLFGLPPLAYVRWSVVPTAGEAELLRIAVAPRARRQGLAHRLLERSEAFLREAAIADLHLEVRRGNLAARTLYEALGWVPAGTRPAYYPDGEAAVLYAKRLR